MKTYANKSRRVSGTPDSLHRESRNVTRSVTGGRRTRDELGAWSDRIQAKLTINQPRDRFEVEADQTADRVVSAPYPAMLQPLVSGPQKDGISPVKAPISRLEQGTEQSLLRQTDEDKEEEVQAGMEQVRRKADPEPEEDEKEDEEQESKSKVSLSAKSEGSHLKPVTGKVETQIRSELRRGHPMDPLTRKFMEHGFNRDFSRVRIHSDRNSARLTRALNAQAFTLGNDIFFSQGRYSTQTRNGRHLLAHELTHVVQQRPDEVRRQPESTLTPEPPAAQITDSPRERDTGVRTPGGKESPRDSNSLTRVPVHKEINESEAPTTEPQPVAPVPLEGKSEQALETFMTSSASQIAATYPALGGKLNEKLKDEKQEVQRKTPPLQARTTGSNLPVEEVAPVTTEVATTDITNEPAESDRPTPKVEPHQNLAEQPDNRKNSKLVEKQESGGFFSWLRENFTSLLNGIKTVDPGVNTNAGKRPAMDTSGSADPGKAEEQLKKGNDTIDKRRSETVEAVLEHPGQKKIRPVAVDQNSEVTFESVDDTATVETQPEKDLDDYARMALPEDVRKAADRRMEPMLKESLAGPRQQMTEAAVTRDGEKKSAVDEAQRENTKLNDDAERSQKDEVIAARQKVADEQGESIRKAGEKAAEYSSEADREQSTVESQVQDQIRESEDQADKRLNEAERESEEEKQRQEARAAAKKRQLEQESKSDSWWDSAVNTVKRAVKFVTDAIDKIFTELREKVKAIIEKAKNAAIELIEKGRKWIVDRLDGFGAWLKSKVDKYLTAFPALQEKLNAFIDGAVDLATKAVNHVADKLKEKVEALAKKLAGALDSILAKFQTGLKAVVGIAGAVLTGDFKEAAKIAFYATCEILGIDPQPIIDFMNNARDRIVWIFKHPVEFFNNVAAGVKKGLYQFKENIRKHLIGGLINWLTGALSSVPITLPEKWNVRGFFSLVMQILGLTYKNIRARVVKRLGPKADTVIGWLEDTVDFVKDLAERGPIVLWEKVKESLSNIKSIIVSKISEWIAISVVKEAIITIVSMLNPASAIVRAVKLLFDLVIWLKNNWERIIDFIKSIFDSVNELAAGKIAKAANYIEKTLARIIPIAIGFLASLLGLGGIGKTVQKIMAQVRKPVNKALDKVINWLVKLGRKLLKGGKAALKKGKAAVKKGAKEILEWWRKKRDFVGPDDKRHTLMFRGTGPAATLVVRGSELPLENFLQENADKIPANKKKLIRKHAATIKRKTGGKAISEAFEHIHRALQSSQLTTASKVRPKSKVTFKPVTRSFTRFGGGTGTSGEKVSTTDGGTMTAAPLSIRAGTYTGSPPSSSGSSPLWYELNQHRPGEYVRAHLLNHNLHGPGNTVKNLTPLPQLDNNPGMEAKIEKHVKEAVVNNNKVVTYGVRMVYGARNRSALPAENLVATEVEATSYEMKLKKSTATDKEAENPNAWEVNKAAPILGGGTKVYPVRHMPKDIRPGTQTSARSVRHTPIDQLRAYLSDHGVQFSRGFIRFLKSDELYDALRNRAPLDLGDSELLSVFESARGRIPPETQKRMGIRQSLPARVTQIKSALSKVPDFTWD